MRNDDFDAVRGSYGEVGGLLWLHGEEELLEGTEVSIPHGQDALIPLGNLHREHRVAPHVEVEL